MNFAHQKPDPTIGSLQFARQSSENFRTEAQGCGIHVPLYEYPGGSGRIAWDKVASVILANNLQIRSFVILNQDNGNFGLGQTELAPLGATPNALNTDFVWARQLLKNNDIEALGYVYTCYGERPVEIVRNRIKLYSELYGADGIILDEMASKPGREEYYSSLNAYVKDLGMTKTVGNAGTPVTDSYLDTLDTVLIYESGGYPDIKKLSEWTFNGRYSPQKFGLTIHSLTSYRREWVLQASKRVRYMYLTPATFPNPYQPVSEYLEDLAKDLGAALEGDRTFFT